MEYTNTESLNDEEFIEVFEQKVKDTVEEFKLFDKNQKLLVAASGGKDSTVLLYLLKKFGYDIEAITINAHIGCYSDASLDNLKKFCSKENIKLHEISLEKEFGYKLCHVMAIMEAKGFNKTSCSICGTLRRYLLNKYSRKLNFDILLTGHNLNDESEGIMMALFNGNLKQVARIGPFANFGEFSKRAKPLYFCFEEEIERYSKIKDFEVHYGWCPCSVKSSRRFYAELGVSFERKFNLARNIIEKIPQLRLFFKSENIKRCTLCEEPSSNSICQTCLILNSIKDPEVKKLKIESLVKKFEEQHNVCDLITIKV